MTASDPLDQRADLAPLLDLVRRTALEFDASLDDGPVRRADAEAAARWFDGGLPESGVGALRAVSALIDHGLPAAIRSSGPRMFHFVTGGVTPAALGGDWLASAIDQNSFSWVSSPLAARLETIVLRWLRELFELPGDWGGVLTTGATMANFAALAAARRWWAAEHGVDVEVDGMAGLPAVPVLTSGLIHTSATKALGMLGIGRGGVRRFERDATGGLDAEALVTHLRSLGGAPAVIVGNAGDVNTGAFDDLERLADIAAAHHAWLHVDGAFGLFARLAPGSAHLAAGVERADSVIADGHKWLNVPYDCGFAFVRDPSLLAGAFAAGAPYLPRLDDPHPNFGYLSPEMSRRARSLTIWATLAASGRVGYRAMVERQLALAQHLAARVDAVPDLERLAPVPLDIVCFRYRPGGAAWATEAVGDAALDALNARLGEMVLEDGRVYVGTTRYAGRVAFRPAIVNWRTSEADVDLLVEVIRELGGRLGD
jgi:glutamate/tyrosine decarboxylase-like PLP-dependent enzyme